MSAKHQTLSEKRSERSAQVAPPTFAERARPWLLAALTAIVVARPLLPSEGVSWIGDGQPFNLLTLVLAAACMLLAIAEGGLARRPNLADVAVGVLVLLMVVSAYVASEVGNARLSANMLFEWVALGTIFFLTRQLVRTPRETRALATSMVALATVLASYGLYQVFIGLPATRAAYAEDPDAAMREMGQWLPPGSVARQQFENRLASSEPLATFALTNSLAGFLAPWLIVGLAIGLSPLVSRDRGPDTPAGGRLRWSGLSIVQNLAIAACLAAIVTCLVLTKSRSAYLAAAVGVVLLPLADDDVRRRLFSWRFAMGAIGVVLAVVIVAVAAGGLDAQVLTEARKSLGYRLEYWQATLAMIGRNPWLGVGPGSFQDYYTQFKLPQASEEVRDPHNFLLEVWATGGTFALVALAEILGLFAWRTWKQAQSSSTHGELANSAAPEPPGDKSALLIAAGAGLAFVLAFVIGPSVRLVFSEQQLIGGLLVGAAAMVAMWPWVRSGRLPQRVPALAVLVFAINLLAAGGIAFPGVAGSLWILLALGFNELDAERDPLIDRSGKARQTWLPVTGLTIAVVAAVACYIVGYRPVVRYYAAMTRAEADNLSTDARINLLIDAAEADPLAAEPWGAIAEIELARLKRDPANSEWADRFVTATGAYRDLRPKSSAAWRQLGRWYYEFFTANRNAKTAEVAAICFGHAVRLYPSFAPLRAEHALALHGQGQDAEARRQIELARQLDRRTPHADKKLSAELREQLDVLEKQLVDPAARGDIK
jgi:hypothetical protein